MTHKILRRQAVSKFEVGKEATNVLQFGSKPSLQIDESVLAFFSNSILISLGLVLLLHSSSCTFELDRGSIMIASSEKKWSRICCIKNAWSSCNFEIKHEHIILLYNGGMGRVERIESSQKLLIKVFQVAVLLQHLFKLVQDVVLFFTKFIRRICCFF